MKNCHLWRNASGFLLVSVRLNRQLILLLLLSCIFNSTYAEKHSAGADAIVQQKSLTVSGLVVDKNREPVIGATIIVKGTANGTTTNLDGKYILKDVSANTVLQFKYLGMKTQEINIDNRSVINVTFEDESIGIEEVVVVGYGTQKKVNLTGAVSSVKMDNQLNSRSLTNVSMALQGKIPGLAISQNSGMAGRKDVKMLIRGMGTVNDADPLVVVDGMPDVDLNRLNMDDIETVSVLKDASSSAVYGSRAANGVILITTKTGKGSKPKINASGSFTIGVPTHAWEFMTDYPRSLTLQQRDAAVNTLPENMRFKNGTIDQWMALGMIDPFKYPSTDWYDVILRDATIQKYNISTSGSNDKSNFFISIGILDEQGLLMNNDYKQYNGRINYEAKIRPNVTVGARFSGNWSDMQYANDSQYDGSIDANQMRYAVAGITPYDPVTGYYGGAMAYGEDLQAYNPYSTYSNQLAQRNRQEANTSAFLNWTIVDGLKARVDYSLNYYNDFRYNADMPNQAYNFQTQSFTPRAYVLSNAGVQNYTNTGYKTQFNGQLSYDFTIAENHKLSAMAVYSREYWYARYQMSGSLDRIHPMLHEIDATLKSPEGVSVAGNSSTEGLISYIGRINYVAYQKYLLEMNLRADGSSKFLDDYRYGFFPSASLGWIFTEESFINSWSKSFIGHGKFRASYGTLGNNSGVNRYEQLEVLSASSYIINGTIQKGLVNKKMINQDFSWEETAVFNLGLDMSFLNNKLSTEFDFYDRLTTGMHRPSDMSILLQGAYTAPRKNIGSLRNRGIEANITWRGKSGELNYTLNLNAAYNATTLEKWNEYLGRNKSDANNSNLIFINMPYAYVYAYEAIGIAQTWNDVYEATPQGAQPGDILYKDLNGDGRIDDNDMKVISNVQEDRPTTNFALNSSFEWKGFDLSLMLQGAAGRKTFWLTANNNPDLSDGRQATTPELWTETWSLENRDAEWTRLGGYNNRRKSTFYLDDLSYLRLKNLQLGYSISQHFLKKVGISSLRAYASADNLLTLSKFRGLDPEKDSVNDGYPLMKSFTFGLSIEF